MSKEKQMFEQMAEDILEDYASSYSIADKESLAEWIHKKFDEYAERRNHGETVAEVMKMVENVCKYEESLSYEIIAEGVKRQIAHKNEVNKNAES